MTTLDNSGLSPLHRALNLIISLPKLTKLTVVKVMRHFSQLYPIAIGRVQCELNSTLICLTGSREDREVGPKRVRNGKTYKNWDVGPREMHREVGLHPSRKG